MVLPPRDRRPPGYFAPPPPGEQYQSDIKNQSPLRREQEWWVRKAAAESEAARNLNDNLSSVEENDDLSSVEEDEEEEEVEAEEQGHYGEEEGRDVNANQQYEEEDAGGLLLDEPETEDQPCNEGIDDNEIEGGQHDWKAVVTQVLLLVAVIVLVSDHDCIGFDDRCEAAVARFIRHCIECFKEPYKKFAVAIVSGPLYVLLAVEYAPLISLALLGVVVFTVAVRKFSRE